MVQCGGVAQDELEMARKTFQKYDVDNSGKIDMAEFTECIHELAPGKSSKEIQAMLIKADADGDGEVNFSEFLHALGIKDEEERMQDEQQIKRRGKDELSLVSAYLCQLLRLV